MLIIEPVNYYQPHVEPVKKVRKPAEERKYAGEYEPGEQRLMDVEA